MKKIAYLLFALAPLALLHVTTPAMPEAPAPSSPPFASVKGAFFALSVSNIDDSAKWYAEKLGLAVDMRTKSGDTSVIVLSGHGLTVELVRHDNAKDFGSDAVLAHGIFKAGLLVDNLDKTLAAVKARKVPIAYGPYPAKPNAPANFIIRDNAGNLIQFFGK
jgi:catechol 2,3-dioxygenase-like lactoylglutathione lyase family enzyme